MASEEDAKTKENETTDTLFDVSEIETKHKTKFLKGYCLYKHIAQRFVHFNFNRLNVKLNMCTW